MQLARAGSTLPWGLAAALWTLPASAEPAAWTLIEEESRLSFEGSQGSNSFTGAFREFSADIRFSPEEPEASSVEVTVDVTSATTGSERRDQQLPSATWFDYGQFPQATYQAESFEALGDDRYRAMGELTLKGITREVPLEFTLRIDGERAVAEGEASLVRTDFNVGTGDFASGDMVGLEVLVTFELHARRAG